MSCTSCNPTASIEVTRGAGTTFLLMVTNKTTKLAVDLTGAKIWFTVKNRLEDVAAIISKKNSVAGGVDGQITITNPQTGATMGQAQVFIDPADTAGLDPEASYWCDAWVQLLGGKPEQVVSNSSFMIDPAVTTSF